MPCYYCNRKEGGRRLFSKELNSHVHVGCLREAIIEEDEEALKLKHLLDEDQRGVPLGYFRTSPAPEVENG